MNEGQQHNSSSNHHHKHGCPTLLSTGLPLLSVLQLLFLFDLALPPTASCQLQTNKLLENCNKPAN